MLRSYERLMGLVAIALACGSPGDLDDSRFPARGQTGYPEDAAGSGGMSVGVAGSGGAGVALGGTGGTGGASGTGATGGGVSAGGTSSGTGGSGTGGSGTGGSGSEPVGQCPEDVSVLLNRPGSEGGCGDPGCHVPDGQVPDLTSPGVEARLLGVASSCNGRPYISAADSFLRDKLVEPMPDCGGFQMPFFMVTALNADERQCMVDWIEEVAAGM